jgi:hypothetical protein
VEKAKHVANTCPIDVNCKARLQIRNEQAERSGKSRVQDPVYFGKLDPDTHYSVVLDPNPHYRQNFWSFRGSNGAVDAHNGGVGA